MLTHQTYVHHGDYISQIHQDYSRFEMAEPFLSDEQFRHKMIEI